MRPDMQACTKGRYRPGRGWKAFQKFADKFDHTSVEYSDGTPELSEKVGSKMRREGWRERAVVHQAPFHRYLQSREGKDWDETYSQIRKNLDFSEVSYWLGYNPAKNQVAMPGHCYWKDGKIHMTEDSFRGWRKWYVDPDTNLLQPWPMNQRPSSYYRPHKPKGPLWHVLDKKKHIYLVRHRGTKTWYRLQLLKDRPEIVGGPWWVQPAYGVYTKIHGWTYYQNEDGIWTRYGDVADKSIHAFEGIDALFTKTGMIYYRPWQQASKEEVESVLNPRPKRTRNRQRFVRNFRSRRS